DYRPSGCQKGQNLGRKNHVANGLSLRHETNVGGREHFAKDTVRLHWNEPQITKPARPGAFLKRFAHRALARDKPCDIIAGARKFGRVEHNLEPLLDPNVAGVKHEKTPPEPKTSLEFVTAVVERNIEQCGVRPI